MFAVGAGLPWVAVAAGLAMGGLGYMSPLWETVIQTHVAPHALSRVMAWDWLVSLVVAPIGYTLAGPFSERVGSGPAFALAATFLGVTSIGVIAVPSVRRLRPTPAAGAAAVPSVADRMPSGASVTTRMWTNWASRKRTASATARK
jgi:hypothetical protein